MIKSTLIEILKLGNVFPSKLSFDKHHQPNLRGRQVGGYLGLAPRLQRKKLRRRRVLEVRLDDNAVPLSVNALLEFGKFH